jgi:putrescine aminotransferase
MRVDRQMLAETKAAHNHPTYAAMSYVMGCGVQGKGMSVHVEDENGRAFLALFDQYGNQSFGYSNERIVAAIREQLATGRLNSTKIMFEAEQIHLTERLAELTGQRLPFAYLANSGGETIDNALKLARAATGRPAFVTAAGCFHGKTFAALSASGRPEHAAYFQPFLESFRQVPFGDVAALEQAIGTDTAAVLLEPVQAEGGVIVPPPDYLRQVRSLCDEAGALLILDEMQTAFGRCGTFFAYEQFDVVPDLLCVGKAFGGGMLPISAVLGTEAVWRSLAALPSTFGSSLGGNPLSCRVGLETIAIASQESFLDAVREKGRLIERRLRDLAESFPDLVETHRGLGMMHGLVFHNEALSGLVLRLLLQRGVMSTYSLYNNRVLRVQPPMVISPDELERGLVSLAETLDAVRAHRERQRAGEELGLSGLTRRSRLGHPAERVRALLSATPHLLDPFALTPERPRTLPVEPEFPGTLGDDAVIWSDRLELPGDGVRLAAQANWLWTRLERSVLVGDAGDGCCELEIRLAWDAGTGPYEGMLGGPIGYFAANRLDELLAAMETRLEKERDETR